MPYKPEKGGSIGSKNNNVKRLYDHTRRVYTLQHNICTNAVGNELNDQSPSIDPTVETIKQT